MGKIVKKGVKGAASNYITRQQAIKKLQITLKDFRRLCILKGIYPREPRNKKKANKGSTAPVTFYYTKDIQHLAHEPLVQSFRDHKTFSKKLSKLICKNDYKAAKALKENKPLYRLDHVIKERYPSFIDALRDLDDALSMLFLFSTMPSDEDNNASVIAECQTLVKEFQAYVIHTKALRKVFYSIKGVYYQAEIKGQTITWVAPHPFSQKSPDEVDFRVMQTFLELYRTLLGFVNFRLYNEINITYPPKLDASLAIYDGGKAAGNGEDEDMVESGMDEFKSNGKAEDEDADGVLRKIQDASNEAQAIRNLFAKDIIYISRESARMSLMFMIRACGGRVSWDATIAPNPPFPESDERITHQVCDRPTVPNRVLSRTYIQPQWIADCINSRKIMNPSLYEPGQVLPPHLSPFVEAKPGDYIPGQEPESEDEAVDLEADNEQEQAPLKANAAVEKDDYERELQAEAAGIPFSEYTESTEANKAGGKTKKKTAQEIEEAEQKEMAHVMMSNKHRKLYKKMQYSNQQKKDEADKLTRRKKELKAQK